MAHVRRCSRGTAFSRLRAQPDDGRPGLLASLRSREGSDSPTPRHTPGRGGRETAPCNNPVTTMARGQIFTDPAPHTHTIGRQRHPPLHTHTPHHTHTTGQRSPLADPAARVVATTTTTTTTTLHYTLERKEQVGGKVKRGGERRERREEEKRRKAAARKKHGLPARGGRRDSASSLGAADSSIAHYHIHTTFLF